MELRTDQTKQRILNIATRGLAPTRRKTHVLIAGAGIAGLVAAYELRRAGHRVTLLEARNRVGGRIYTARDGIAKGLTAEVGAMRIPTNHELTMSYVQRFGLKTAPFKNDNPNAYTFIRAQRRRFSDPVDDLFDLESDERGKKIGSLLDRDLAPLTQLIVEQGDDGWSQILDRWERASLRDFLVEHGWSDGAIEMFGILSRHESLMNTSFLEFFQGSNDVPLPMVRIVDGMDRLPNKFLPELEPSLRYGAVVRRLEQGPDYVRVHYDNAAGHRSVTGDYLIVTLPYAVLRHIDVTPEFSQSKQRAIRQIHYDNASKIFLQFRRRFWEEEGIFFGTTVTDLPVRNVVYPEHDHPTHRGLLLASYTWSQDAHRWAALTEPERLAQALDNITRIHPPAAEHFEAGFSHIWQADPFAGGAYTVFLPGQQRRLHHDICMPQGRMHFAGEHTAMHRWVEGAVESGLRAASEVVHASQTGEALDGSDRLDVWTELPDRLKGRRAFEIASLAIQRDDIDLLQETLVSHPEIVQHRQPSTTAPYDGIYAASTLLHHAVGAPFGKMPAQTKRMVEMLLATGADPNAVSGGGKLLRGTDTHMTALTLVINQMPENHSETIGLIEGLEQGGADLDEGKGRALHAALTGSARNAALDPAGRYLRSRGAVVDLAFAAGLGDVEAMQAWLTTESFGPSAYDRYRPERDKIDSADRKAVLSEALVFAAQRNQSEAVQLLIDHGTSVDSLASIHGIQRSAMHAASQGDHIEIVKLLLGQGANPLVTDSEWAATPLAWAWVASSARVVDHLCQVPGGMVINDLIYVGSPQEIQERLAGQHPDHGHAMGTPGILLRNAAFAGRDSVCAVLVELGADLNLASDLGQLPWQIARDNGHDAIAHQLKP